MADNPLKNESPLKRINTFFEGHRAIIEFFGLVIALLVLWTYRQSNELTQEAIKLNRDGLALNRWGIELNKKGLDELAQSNATNRKALELNQNSVELTRQSLLVSQDALRLAREANDISNTNAKFTEQIVSATKDELKLAQKGYDISNQSLLVANTPWLKPQITGFHVSSYGASGAVKINVTITNLSDKPATNVFVSCGLEGGDLKDTVPDIFMLTRGDGDIAIMPKEAISFEEYIIPNINNKRSAQELKTMISESKKMVDVFISYKDTLGNVTNFAYGFIMYNGGFALSKAKYNMSAQDMIKEYFPEMIK